MLKNNLFIKKDFINILKLGLLIILSKLSVFLLDLFLSNFFGVTNTTDAIIICSSITTGFLNFYFLNSSRNLTSYSSGFNVIEQFKLSTNVILFNLIFLIPIGIILIYYSYDFIRLLFPYAELEAIQLSAFLFKFFILSALINLITHHFNVVNLNNKKSNLIPLSNIISALITCVFILIYYYNNLIFYLGFGYVIGPLVQSLIIFTSVHKKINYSLPFDFNFIDGKKIFLSILPLILIQGFTEITKIYERSLASSIDEGVVSSLYYSNKLNLSIIGILISIFSYKILPILSKNYYNNRLKYISNTKMYLLYFIISTLLLVIAIHFSSEMIISYTINLNDKIDELSLINESFLIYNLSSIFYLLVNIVIMINISSRNYFIAYFPLLIMSLSKFITLYVLGNNFISPILIPKIHLYSYLLAAIVSVVLLIRNLREIKHNLN